jgi:hypothetical protein
VVNRWLVYEGRGMVWVGLAWEESLVYQPLALRYWNCMRIARSVTLRYCFLGGSTTPQRRANAWASTDWRERASICCACGMNGLKLYS